MTTVLYDDPRNPGQYFSLQYLTDFNDYWVGLLGIPQHIFGGNGHDTLLASSGNDVLAGGEGNDLVSGGEGHDRLFGDSGNDTIDGGSGVDVISGGSGHDKLAGGGDSDTIEGGSGDDTIYTRSSFDSVDPLVLDVRVVIHEIGDAGLDEGGFFDGGIGNDMVYVDVFFRGQVEIHGGSGRDRIDLNESTWVFSNGVPSGVPAQFVNLSTGLGQTITGGELRILGVEDVFGSEFRDVLTGDNHENELRGRANTDRLEGRGGADRLDGGTGTDTASYESAGSRVYVDLTLEVQKKIAVIDGQGFFNGDAAEDRLISIEDLRGSNHNDFLRGNAARNLLDGGHGNDILEGRGGGDILRGGVGHDIASYVSSATKVNVGLVNSTPRFGDAEGDVLESIEGIHGSHFNDMLYGSNGANTLHGNNGDDYLYGWGGNDTVRGGDGSDKIYGGTGRDVLWGDAGADTFRFSAVDSISTQIDVIMDFRKDYLQNGAFIDGDTIDFSSIDTNPNAIGNQSFTSAYAMGPVGIAASFYDDTVRFRAQQDAAGRMYTKVEAEWTGDGQADLVLHVYTVTNQLLSSSDFIL